MSDSLRNDAARLTASLISLDGIYSPERTAAGIMRMDAKR